VFYYQNKYYIVDWKFNHLGYNYNNYKKDDLIKAISNANYYLQYYIYILSLYKYLNTEIKFIADDIGGVFYIFARGVQENGTTGIYFDRAIDFLKGITLFTDTDVSNNLKKLYDNGFIDKIGYYNALFVSKFCKENNKVLIQMSSALISYCLDKGHTCVELKDFEGQDLNSFKENENESKVNNILFHFPHIEEWIEKLKNSGVVGLLDDNKPLAIDGKGRLFFRNIINMKKNWLKRYLVKHKV